MLLEWSLNLAGAGGGWGQSLARRETLVWSWFKMGRGRGAEQGEREENTTCLPGKELLNNTRRVLWTAKHGFPYPPYRHFSDIPGVHLLCTVQYCTVLYKIWLCFILNGIGFFLFLSRLSLGFPKTYTPLLLFSGYRTCFPGAKAAGTWSWLLTYIKRWGYERVELYLYSPSVPLCRGQGQLCVFYLLYFTFLPFVSLLVSLLFFFPRTFFSVLSFLIPSLFLHVARTVRFSGPKITSIRRNNGT